MKSNSGVFLQYVYRHGESFSMTEDIKDTIMDHKAKMLDLYEMWIEDDEWLQLPQDDFEITNLNLYADGKPANIQFTERRK